MSGYRPELRLLGPRGRARRLSRVELEALTRNGIQRWKSRRAGAGLELGARGSEAASTRPQGLSAPRLPSRVPPAAALFPWASSRFSARTGAAIAGVVTGVVWGGLVWAFGMPWRPALGVAALACCVGLITTAVVANAEYLGDERGDVPESEDRP